MTEQDNEVILNFPHGEEHNEPNNVHEVEVEVHNNEVAVDDVHSENEINEVIEDDQVNKEDSVKGDFENKFEQKFERILLEMTTEFKNGMHMMKSSVQQSLREFDNKLGNLQTQLDSKGDKLRPQETVNKKLSSIEVQEETLAFPVNNDKNRVVRHNANREISVNARNNIKPHTFNGEDDLDEYLTQFNIVAELNQWGYETKSLYLASSIVGNARAILCELDDKGRKDYDSIVQTLQIRYGSIHRAEIYRSKLQSRTLERNETLPELAQSIRKLTRKAYPSATKDVLELLAIDHFIDALPDTDIRLRLREVGPTSISEAEKIAVRLDAHKVADKNRGKHSVRSVQPEVNQTEKKLNELSEQMKKLMKDMSEYRQHTIERPINRTGYQNNKAHNSNHNANRYNQGRYPKQNYLDEHKFHNQQDSRGFLQQRRVGNEMKSGLRTETRPTYRGPQSKK